MVLSDLETCFAQRVFRMYRYMGDDFASAFCYSNERALTWISV